MSVIQSQRSRLSPVRAQSAGQYWRQVSVLEVDPTAAAPERARRHVVSVLPQWRLPPGLSADAAQVASELTACAVRSALAFGLREPAGLRLLCDRRRLVVEVWDCAPDTPAQRPGPTGGAVSGAPGPRITEQLANQWGCQRISAQVKMVWAELLVSTYLDPEPEPEETLVGIPKRAVWPSPDWCTQTFDGSAIRGQDRSARGQDTSARGQDRSAGRGFPVPW